MRTDSCGQVHFTGKLRQALLGQAQAGGKLFWNMLIVQARSRQAHPVRMYPFSNRPNVQPLKNIFACIQYYPISHTAPELLL